MRLEVIHIGLSRFDSNQVEVFSKQLEFRACFEAARIGTSRLRSHSKRQISVYRLEMTRNNRLYSSSLECD